MKIDASRNIISDTAKTKKRHPVDVVRKIGHINVIILARLSVKPIRNLREIGSILNAHPVDVMFLK